MGEGEDGGKEGGRLARVGSFLALLWLRTALGKAVGASVDAGWRRARPYAERGLTALGLAGGVLAVTVGSALAGSPALRDRVFETTPVAAPSLPPDTRDELAALRQQVAGVRADLARTGEAGQQRITALRQRAATLSAQVSALEAADRRLRAQQGADQAAADAARADLTAAAGALRGTTDALAGDVRTLARDAQAETKARGAGDAVTRQQVDALAEVLADVDARLAAADVALAGSIATVERELRAAVAAEEAARARGDAAEAEARASAVRALSDALGAVQGRVDALSAAVSSLRADVQGLTGRADALEQALSREQQTRADADADLDRRLDAQESRPPVLGNPAKDTEQDARLDALEAALAAERAERIAQDLQDYVRNDLPSIPCDGRSLGQTIDIQVPAGGARYRLVGEVDVSVMEDTSLKVQLRRAGTVVAEQGSDVAGGGDGVTRVRFTGVVDTVLRLPEGFQRTTVHCASRVSTLATAIETSFERLPG